MRNELKAKFKQSECRKPHEISCNEIKQACQQAFGVTKTEFEDSTKSDIRLCRSRQAYWLISRRIKLLTLNDIASDFDRNKNNIAQSIKRFSDSMKDNRIILETFLSIGQLLNSRDSINKIAEDIINGEK